MRREATNFAVLMPMEKQIPWAMAMTAVLTPITCPRESTSGPPELPGFNAEWAGIRWSTGPPLRRRNGHHRQVGGGIRAHGRGREAGAVGQRDLDARHAAHYVAIGED